MYLPKQKAQDAFVLFCFNSSIMFTLMSRLQSITFCLSSFRQGPFSHTGTRTLKQSVKGNTRFANLSCNISCAMFFSCCILSDLKPCVFNKSSTSLFSSTCKFDVVRLIYEHNEFNSFSSAVRARQKRNVFHE